MLFKTLNLIFSRISINAINQLVFLFSIPVLAHRLDLIVFGQLSICFVIMQLSWAISEWGVENYSIEKWSSLTNNNQQSGFISRVVNLNFVIALSFLAIIFLLVVTNILEIPLLFLYALIPGALFGSIYPLWFYQVMKIPQEMIFPTFLSRCLFLAIILLAVKDNNSAYIALLAQGLSLFIIVIYAFLRMFTKYSFRWKSSKINEIVIILRSSFPFFINSFTNNQINTLWGFGLSVTSGPYAMALFNLGDQLYRAGGAISNIIAQSVRIQFIGKSFYSSRFTILFFVGSYILIAISISWAAHFLIDNFFPQEYLPATQIIQVMMLAWGLHAVVKLLNYPILGQMHGAEWVNKITYKILFLHLIAFLIWMYFFDGPFSLAMMLTLVITIQLIIYLTQLLRSIRK